MNCCDLRMGGGVGGWVGGVILHDIVGTLSYIYNSFIHTIQNIHSSSHHRVTVKTKTKIKI